MKLAKKLTTLAIVSVLAISAQAADVTINASGGLDGGTILGSNGVATPNGNLVAVVKAGAAFDINTLGTDPLDYDALITAGSLVEIGTTATIDFGVPGTYDGSMNGGWNTPAGTGESFYFITWDAPVPADATEYGIFGAPATWLIPDGLTALTKSITVDLNQSTVAVAGSLVDLGGGKVNVQMVSLVPIPEPSTYILMLLGMGGLFVYLRRK